MGDGGNESVAVTAGIWGFIILFGLAIACWLLFRSMNKHIRTAQWNEDKRAREEGREPVRRDLGHAIQDDRRGAEKRSAATHSGPAGKKPPRS